LLTSQELSAVGGVEVQLPISGVLDLPKICGRCIIYSPYYSRHHYNVWLYVNDEIIIYIGVLLAAPVNTIPIKRKEKIDPRSSLVNMEYEEHLIRMKTMHVEYEDAILKKEITMQKKIHDKKLQDLQLKKAQLELDKLQEI